MKRWKLLRSSESTNMFSQHGENSTWVCHCQIHGLSFLKDCQYDYHVNFLVSTTFHLFATLLKYWHKNTMLTNFRKTTVFKTKSSGIIVMLYFVVIAAIPAEWRKILPVNQNNLHQNTPREDRSPVSPCSLHYASKQQRKSANIRKQNSKLPFHQESIH